MIKNNKRIGSIIRGLTVIEYTLLIVAVSAAFLGMGVFLRRAVSGRWKQSADIFGFGRQYSPGKTTVGTP
jgi:Flp pilus assembly pilin Flp